MRSRRMGSILEVVEEADAFSEDDWHEVEVQLVDESRGESLPRHVAAHHAHVPAAGGFLGEIDRPLQALGDEDEGQLVRVLGRVVGDDEERPVEGRRAAPAVRCVVGVAADDYRADSSDERVEDLTALVGEVQRLALVALEEPGIEPAHLAVRARHVAVERDGVGAEDGAHAALVSRGGQPPTSSRTSPGGGRRSRTAGGARRRRRRSRGR